MSTQKKRNESEWKDDQARDASGLPAEGDAKTVSGLAEEPSSGCDDATLRERFEILGAELASLKAELLVVREEMASLNDKYLRKLADEVNFRKRMVKDKEDARKFAIVGFLRDMVPALDDFDRAMSSVDASPGRGELFQGVALIRRQIVQMLENKYGLKKMESLGSPFDPNRHEAVAMETGSSGEPVVCEEYLPGYVVGETVVRTAKVKVRMPAIAGMQEPPAVVAGDGPDASMVGDEARPDAGN